MASQVGSELHMLSPTARDVQTCSAKAVQLIQAASLLNTALCTLQQYWTVAKGLLVKQVNLQAQHQSV